MTKCIADERQGVNDYGRFNGFMNDTGARQVARRRFCTRIDVAAMFPSSHERFPRRIQYS